MGWGNGMSIGWPNASNQGGVPTVYSFGIYYCGQGISDATVYSLSSNFAPGIYVYDDPELTIPSNLIGYAGAFPIYVTYITDGLVGDQEISCRD